MHCSRCKQIYAHQQHNLQVNWYWINRQLIRNHITSAERDPLWRPKCRPQNDDRIKINCVRYGLMSSLGKLLLWWIMWWKYAFVNLFLFFFLMLLLTDATHILAKLGLQIPTANARSKFVWNTITIMPYSNWSTNKSINWNGKRVCLHITYSHIL